jgi:hypothetical protein
MADERAEQPKQPECDISGREWPHELAAEVLGRVKDIAQQIAERVRQVTDDTRTDYDPISPDQTSEQPPLS